MISLLDNVVLDGKFLHQVPLKLLDTPFSTTFEDVVGGPQLVVESWARKTFEHLLIPGTMNEPLVDNTVIFLGILFLLSVPFKVAIAIIQVAKSPQLCLLITIEGKLGQTMTTWVGALVVANSTSIVENLLVSIPAHCVMRNLWNATLIDKL